MMCQRHQARPHSLSCFLPPFILRHIAESGALHERKQALDTLELDASIRQNRAAQSAAFAAGGTLARLSRTADAQAEAKTPTAPRKLRTIYDSRHTTQRGGDVPVRSEGAAPVADAAVNEAYDGLGATFDFYLAAYQRNSIDNAGMPMVANVHFSDHYDNAMWDGTEMLFGDGDGIVFQRFTRSVDVIGHELTHGVTQHAGGLNYDGQSGALNESLSDVFGSLVKQYKKKQSVEQADWLIGSELLVPGLHAVAVRSMKDPGSAFDDPKLGKDPQPKHMSKYYQGATDNHGVHINSGIPNHAFYLAAVAIGGHAWEKTGRIWYDSLHDAKMKPSIKFAQFAAITKSNAERLHGAGGREAKAVVDAWKQVGVLA